MNLMKISLSIFLLVTSHINFLAGMNTQPSMLSKIYCLLLGNDDASLSYQERIRHVLEEMGVENPASVSVKKMNTVGPFIAQDQLSTFTAFGIWVNESYLDTLDEAEKEFLIYHEVAHYVHKHHQKLIGKCSLSGIVAVGGLIGLNHLLQSCDALTHYGLLIGGSLIALAGGYRYLMPYLVREQEKEADIKAASVLVEKNKTDILEHHIQQLKDLEKLEKNHTWWPSFKEQIKYLNEILKSEN